MKFPIFSLSLPSVSLKIREEFWGGGFKICVRNGPKIMLVHFRFLCMEHGLVSQITKLASQKWTAMLLILRM